MTLAIHFDLVNHIKVVEMDPDPAPSKRVKADI